MLTDKKIVAEIKAVENGGPAEKTLNDGADGRGTGSLRLRIRRNGKGEVSAVWLAWWKADGNRSSKTLGRYPDLPLKDARDKFRGEVSPLVQAGKNPHAMAPPTTDKPTVGKLFQSYVDDMREKNRSSADEVERALLTGKWNAADALGRDRLAGTIEGGDVAQYLGRTYKRGSRVMADRARSYISAAFNWGLECSNDYTAVNRQDWGIKFNPAATVKRDTSASKARERALAADEIRAVWHAVDGDGFALETACAVRLLLTCGQRVRETLRVDGCEADLDAALWSMPAEKTKTKKRPHYVPLTPAAVEVFRQLKAVHGDGALFPARAGKGKRLSDGAVNRALAKWCKNTGAERFQTRDLRRTWKSRCGDGAKVDRFTRDLIQQHAQEADTGSKHYDMADYLPQMRDGMKRWGKWLSSVVRYRNNQSHAMAA